ncbi:MAG: hypothetical protein Q9200_003107 [Gallowayella weberi]
MEPPHGETPEFDSPGSSGQSTTVVVFCLSFCTVLLLVQLLTKRILIRALQYEDCKTLARWFANINSVIWLLLMLVLKSAVLLQYLRIFVPVRNHVFYLTWLLIAMNSIFNLGLTLAFAFQCVPRRKIWDPSIPGHCINLGITVMISAASNTVTDFATLLLPLYTAKQPAASYAAASRLSPDSAATSRPEYSNSSTAKGA